MTLDVRTAFVLTGMVCLLAALTVGVLRRLHEPSRMAMVRLATALGLGSASASTAALHGKIADWASTSLPICLAGASFAVVYQSMRRLYDLDAQVPALGASVALLVLLVMLSPDGRFALTVHYGFQAVFMAASFAVVLRAHDAPADRGRMALLAFFVLVGTSAAYRAGRMFVGDTELSIADAHLRLWSTMGLVPVMQLLAPLVLMILVIGIAMSRQLADLELQSSTDELTGTASRRHLFAQGDRWLDRHARGNRRVAVMMIDVDDFKSVNDRYGHLTGDRVLRHVANVLERHLPAGGVLARYGGEEFCALLPVDDTAEAHEAAELLRRAAETSPFLGEEGTILVTVSIGLAVRAEASADKSLAELLRIADRRVYRAKAAGRNRVADDEPIMLEIAVV